MSTVIDLVRRPNVDASTCADDFIAAARVRLSDRIVIAGAAHLDFLLVLTRRGFARVSCQSPDHCPHIRCEKADAIFAPALRDEARALSVLKGMAAALNPGGVLVLETPPLEPTAELRLRAALRTQGFDAVASVGARSSGAVLWRAEKRPAAMVHAA